jgi:hypothetical protein
VNLPLKIDEIAGIINSGQGIKWGEPRGQERQEGHGIQGMAKGKRALAVGFSHCVLT